MPTFEDFTKRRTALLSTYKRDGTTVATPVTIAVDGDRAYVRTWDSAWKAKRMRNNPAVLVAPSTIRGRVTGPTVGAHARLLDGEEAAHAARAIAHRQPILQGVLVPVAHRVMRYRTLHYELTLDDATLDP
jgi:PPOX class probable F420-dependent enzyme